MNKKIYLLLFAMIFSLPAFAAPPGANHGFGGRHGLNGGGMRPPVVGRPPMHASMRHDFGRRPPVGGMRPLPMHHIAARPLPPPPPPIYRPYRPIPIYRPYYSSVYMPSILYYSSYSPIDYVYTGVEPVLPTAESVVVRDNYAGINPAANVINTAANVAATIRYLTW